jgi:Chromo (CHRromatin Organisation MOdifier) domain
MQWSIHDIFHIDLLTPYCKTSFHGPNFTRPPPELINVEEEYEVENILDQWQFGRSWHKQYLIEWKGYPDSENQWVNTTDVHAPEALAEFQSSNTLTCSRIRRGSSTDKAHHFFLHNHMSTSPTRSPLTNVTKSYADAVHTPPAPIIRPNDPRNFLVLS